MKNVKSSKIASLLLVSFFLVSPFLVALKIPSVRADTLAQSLYLWIDPAQGGASVQCYLNNSYTAMNITVDISNATHQNDECFINLYSDNSATVGFYWDSTTNNSHPEYYDQDLNVHNATNYGYISLSTDSFMPTLVWDGYTLYWYGNASGVLLGSLDTSAFFNCSIGLDYIQTNMCWDSGSVTENFWSANYLPFQENLATINSEATDGFMEYYNTSVDSWETGWNSANASIIDDTDTSEAVGSYYHSLFNTVQIMRGFVPFDTSSIPSNATILNATLRLFNIFVYPSPDDTNLTIQNGQPTYPHNPLELSDFDRTLYAGDGGSIYIANWTSDHWENITLNDGALAWIQKEGETKLLLRTLDDISGNSTAETFFAFSTSETSSARAPKLEVGYLEPIAPLPPAPTVYRTIAYDWVGDGLVTPSNGSWVNIGGNVYAISLPDGDGVSLSEVPNSGSVFVIWNVDGTNTSTATTYNFTVTADSTVTAYFDYLPPAPARYWFNWSFTDQNSDPIATSEFDFTWSYDGNHSIFNYALGNPTLYAGLYDCLISWKGIDISSGGFTLDTASQGNHTSIFGTVSMLPWQNGYIYTTDTGANITVNSQDDSHLNTTISGASGNYNTTISGYTKDPTTVEMNNTSADYTYSDGQETVTIPSNGTADSVIYIEPTKQSGSGGTDTGDGSSGGSWSKPFTDFANQVVQAIKSISASGIYAIIIVVGIIAVAGMFSGKGKSKTPSRSFRER